VFGRCERIRTSDPFVPNEVRYQAAPHTDISGGPLYQTRLEEPMPERLVHARSTNENLTKGGV
jgi:hypothetical protein